MIYTPTLLFHSTRFMNRGDCNESIVFMGLGNDLGYLCEHSPIRGALMVMVVPMLSSALDHGSLGMLPSLEIGTLTVLVVDTTRQLYTSLHYPNSSCLLHLLIVAIG